MSRSSVINKIDGLYQNSISSLSPRIMVRGEQNYLRNDDNAAIIRALLLAGIRCGVLWQQLGGGKWTLFWRRIPSYSCGDLASRGAPQRRFREAAPGISLVLQTRRI